MDKVKEGSRLTQLDMVRINELYGMLQGKTDKDELFNKVDKPELKRAYRFLAKRVTITQIETLKKEVKLTEQQLTLHQNKDEPLLFKKKLDLECIACGQSLSTDQSYREPRNWQKMPPSNLRFGPGFSKILPKIEPRHRKSHSELPLHSERANSVKKLRPT